MTARPLRFIIEMVARGRYLLSFSLSFSAFQVGLDVSLVMVLVVFDYDPCAP